MLAFRRCFPAPLTAAFALTTLLLLAAGCQRGTGAAAGLQTPEGVPIVRVLVARGAAIRLAATGGYRLYADGRPVADSPAGLAACAVSREGQVWSLGPARYRAGQLTLDPAGGGVIRLDGTGYRGRVVLLPDGPRGIRAVNHVDVETYLAGVLPRELLGGWSLEAYKAQAIAARTYALHERADRRGGHDLRADVLSQVYGGADAETPVSRQAVGQTRGVVLAAGPPGREKLIAAHFSSCCGGRTNNVGVLYGPWAADGPLAGGVACDDCRASPRFRWPTVTVSKAELARALDAQGPSVGVGPIRSVQVARRDADRPVWVRLTGLDGQRRDLRAERLRLALLAAGSPAGKALFSMNCRIRDAGDAVAFEAGRGFGHGVGLCQWGAEGKARRGWPAEKIVLSYYPGARLYRAY